MLYFHYFSCPWPAQFAFWFPAYSPCIPVIENSTHSAMFVAWSPMRSKYLTIIKTSIAYSPESGFWWIMLMRSIHYLRNINCSRSFYLEFIHFWRQILHINKEIIHFIYIHKYSTAPQCGRPHNNWLYRSGLDPLAATNLCYTMKFSSSQTNFLCIFILRSNASFF